MDKILNYAEIQTIISALGCGIGEDELDIARMRYGKIIIMTDADVDGSHIRTLLLTFFFRHMKPLITHGRVFIAQPPLYLVQRRRTKKYVLNEREMRTTLTGLGLDGTRLELRDYDGKKTQPARVEEIQGAKLQELNDLLVALADRIHILERRGLTFPALLDRRKNGKLPTHWLVVNGEDIFCYSDDEYESLLAGYARQAVVDDENGNAPGEHAPEEAETDQAVRIERRAELHEVRKIEDLLAKLDQRGLPVDDYYTIREESVSGDKPPARYVLINEDDVHELDNISQIAPGIREIGSKGIEIKRFKGLGEMNADELWETTMDPERRMLLRVRAEEAEEAERMFSLLMGDNVEKRRGFIEENALTVKNLDV
jgi:DNA gyrase subunit B